MKFKESPRRLEISKIELVDVLMISEILGVLYMSQTLKITLKR